MDDLRLILLLVGVVLIAGIYAWDRYRHRQPGSPDDDEASITLGAEALQAQDAFDRLQDARAVENVKRMTDVGNYDIDALDSGIRLRDIGPHVVEEVYPSTGQGWEDGSAERAAQERLALDGLYAPNGPAHGTGAGSDTESDPLVVVLTIMARPGQQLAGGQVRQALEDNGLRFGDMRIYHHREAHEVVDGGPAFSVASVVEPGVLEPKAMDGLTLPGLVMFMRLPGLRTPESTFQTMLDTAERVAGTLGALLCDEARSRLTPQSINHIRERITEFGRRRMLTP